MLSRWLLLISFSFSAHALSGVGESKAEIRDRYQKIIFSVREQQPRGPVREDYDYLGRTVEVHYENYLSAREVFHGINTTTEALRLLQLTQAAGEWKVTKKDGETTEWESGPLRAQHEKDVLRVFAAKEEKAPTPR